jgi:hypothetical protein
MKAKKFDCVEMMHRGAEEIKKTSTHDQERTDRILAEAVGTVTKAAK